jgi:hypothetical protein
MVGDSVFPGQPVPAVALGGLRVAERILHEGGYQGEFGALRAEKRTSERRRQAGQVEPI